MPRSILLPSDAVAYRTRNTIFGCGINERQQITIAELSGIPRSNLSAYKKKPLTIPWYRIVDLVQSGVITSDDLVYMAPAAEREEE